MIQQVAIHQESMSQFDRQLHTHLKDGYRVVPGTIAVTAVPGQCWDYFIVVEKETNGNQAQEAVSRP